MDKTFVVIGANGQLGSEMMRLWPAAIGLTHREIEVSNIFTVHPMLSHIRPSLVLNTAAYHRVDDIENFPPYAFAVNALGARNLAMACKELDAILVHISTDYVFSGRNRSLPYLETAPVDPINAYGVSKATGEMFIRYIWPKHFIVRTSGLYGSAGSSGKGSNFVELMLTLARESKPIKVVNDQTLTPTSTRSLAEQIAVLGGSSEFGTYHVTCQGQCTWFEFAQEIFKISGLSANLSPQSTAESGSVAARPRYSVLENRSLQMRGIDRMPSWQSALEKYLEERIGP